MVATPTKTLGIAIATIRSTSAIENVIESVKREESVIVHAAAVGRKRAIRKSCAFLKMSLVLNRTLNSLTSRLAQ